MKPIKTLGRRLAVVLAVGVLTTVALGGVWPIGANRALAVELQVFLEPTLDQYGSQIEIFQEYRRDGVVSQMSGIYDTGASVITVSAEWQASADIYGYEEIPIKVSDGAVAEAIGGRLIGDVSEPGTIAVDGLHALDLSGGALSWDINMSQATSVGGVQVFVGTTTGSAALPTIAGTPIHYPNPAVGAPFPNGSAARIEMQGYLFDLGALFGDLLPEFAGLVVSMPDLYFVQPGTKLEQVFGENPTGVPVRVPLELWGESNQADPGDEITYSENPVQTNVALSNTNPSDPNETLSVDDQMFLFDTGAQLSIISSKIAQQLGLDLNAPETTIDVQGAAGVSIEVPGYTIDSLILPLDDDGDQVFDGSLEFVNVPIYVLDVIEGLDGILGMNLFNTVNEMLYDPFDPDGPSVSFTFLEERLGVELSEEQTSSLDLLADLDPLFAELFSTDGMPLTIKGFAPVPEPSTVALLAIGGLALLATWMRRRRTEHSGV